MDNPNRSRSDRAEDVVQLLLGGELIAKINKDVEKSAYKTRAAYFKALFNRLLSLKKISGEKSCLGTFCRWVDFIEKLPINEIKKVAKTRNCSLPQASMELIQESLMADRLDLRTRYISLEDDDLGLSQDRKKVS